MTTFTSRLIELSSNLPDKTVLHFQKVGQEDVHLSYRDIIQGAKYYACVLKQKKVQPGEVVVIVLQHCIEIIFAYFGCIMNGCIPSIMPFMTEKLLPEKYREDLLSLVKITNPSAIITYRNFQEEILSKNDDYKKLNQIIIEETEIGKSTLGQNNEDWFTGGQNRLSTDIVLLQHSSGSTGLQKGVALSHEAVFNQIESYRKAINLSENDVIVSWLPLYHDMGLIACFLMPLLTATPLVLMSPFDWVRAPYRLMTAISSYKGTLCWLPNFAYNFCAHKIRESDMLGANLQSLRAVINCSEPMRLESHNIFYNHFSKYGLQEDALSTCYAMAENVFAVTQDGIRKPVTYDVIDLERFQIEKIAQPFAENKLSLTMVSAGTPIEGTHVRIIDEQGTVLKDRHVGEIIIKSNCMLTEYFNRQDETKKSFINGWFKTGDIGYIADDELFISGRKKDLIIVGGKNIYPQDIENLISHVKGVHPGRTVAFGLFNEEKGTEDVVVIAEVEKEFLEKKNELTLEIKRTITQNTAIALRNVYLVDEFWLIKTSSGKIARSANKQKYLQEVMSLLHKPHNLRYKQNLVK